MDEAEAKHGYAVIVDRRLRGTEAWMMPVEERIVLRTLAGHADEAGRCFPSIPTLAGECGLSEERTRKALRALEGKGWCYVSNANRFKADGGRTSDERTLTPGNGQWWTKDERSKLRGFLSPDRPPPSLAGHPLVSPGDTTPVSPGTTTPVTPGVTTLVSPGDTGSTHGSIQGSSHGSSHVGAASRPLPPVGTTASLFDAPDVKPERAAPKRRIPDGWTMKRRHETLAISLGLPTGHVQSAAERFKGHHGAKGTTFANWDQAFDNWLRNDADRFKAGGPGVRGASPGGMRRPVNNRQDTGWATVVPDDAADDAIESMIRGAGGVIQPRGSVPGSLGY